LKDYEGKNQFYYFDLDPIVLYEFSTPDESKNLKIGQLIRNERKKAGLTQEQLAKKSGTSKHYISRLENDKSDIELLTLKKIIEAGLGREMKIQID
jgi:DNA-binding XRE family transcriptional regulator